MLNILARLIRWRKMKKILLQWLTLLLLIGLSACGGGGSSSSTGGTTYTATSGVAQKGPLLLGSLVTAQELDAKLSPMGKQYTYQINSGLGTFAPTSKFTSQYIDLNATGYYYDEVANGVSSGFLTLNGIADLSSDTVLNVNLLTTLAYQRIKALVTTQGMRVTAARSQAEGEVLAALNIPNGNSYGNFGSLDLSKGSDGDNILAAISSLFVNGNNAGNLSALIANFQSDIAANGVITNSATKTALANSAATLNPATVASNLTAEYSSLGLTFAATNISNWIDQGGNGIVGNFVYQVANASPTSTFAIPAAVVTHYAGLPITVSAGQLSVNGMIASGAVTINSGDTVVVSPSAGLFSGGVFALYLKKGSTNLAKVTFVKGLASIAVTPAIPSVPNGLTQQFISIGTFSDSSTADISSLVTWSSGTPTVAIINTTGLSTGVALGSSTITATYSGIIGSTSLTVTSAVMQSINITPPSPYTGVGYAVQLAATGIFSDGTTSNITNSTAWLSGTPTVATINASTGLVTGIAIGTSAVTATLNGIIGNSTFTVTSNPWSVTGNLITPRAQHTATLLPNGKVLVVGGNGPLVSAELYDPATGIWSAAASLNTARSSHSATLLANGKVLVVGGSSAAGIFASAELYDPTTNTWSAAASMTSARTVHTAILLSNGKVLVAGGVGGLNGSGFPISIASAELYDPTTNTWATAASLTTARFNHTANLLAANGKVLVVGGYSSSASLALASAELYDPTTNTWTAEASLTTARYSHTANQLANGKVLVAAGTGSGGPNFLASAELYDPIANTWSPAGSLTTARADFSSTLLPNGQVLVVGGDNLTLTLASAELYDPTANTWSGAGSLSLSRNFHTATLLANGKVLVVGGSGPGAGSAELSWAW
jgi:N-acetylneuraminic acid mutarotase